MLYSSADLDRIRARMDASRERFRIERVKNGWRFDAEAAAAAGI